MLYREKGRRRMRVWLRRVIGRWREGGLMGVRKLGSWAMVGGGCKVFGGGERISMLWVYR